MHVFARFDSQTSHPAGPCLLLEGDWPPTAAGEERRSLDASFDGRHAEIDAAAERLATSIGEAAATSARGANFADVNALRLRYAAVRWLRVVAWFERCVDLLDRRPWTLHVDLPRDAEYVALFEALAERRGCALRIVAAGGDAPDVAPPPAPPNPAWRRLLGRWLARGFTPRSNRRPRVMLCGNPRILDPVCAELLRQGADPVWLYDRFAVGALRWRLRGVRQVVCNASEATAHDFPTHLSQRPIVVGDVDLTGVVEAWYRREVAWFGPAQARLRHTVAEHVDRFRPDYVVVDEDATPLSRMLLDAARRRGARSIVVQHGICGIRFGFAPQKADVCCVWDRASARQLTRWGIDRARIAVTGSPYVDRVLREVAAVRRRRSAAGRDVGPLRVALIGTTPPRDDRPDAVEFHWTARSYESLLEAAFRALESLPDAEVWLRPHPRAGADAAWRRAVERFPRNRIRDVAELPVAEVLGSVDVVLSCPSSLAVEAAQAGLPVVQLLPDGAGAVAPAAWYGLRGPVSTESAVREALRVAAAEPRGDERAVRGAFGGVDHADAARRIVDVLFDRATADGAERNGEVGTMAAVTGAAYV